MLIAFEAISFEAIDILTKKSLISAMKRVQELISRVEKRLMGEFYLVSGTGTD